MISKKILEFGTVIAKVCHPVYIIPCWHIAPMKVNSDWPEMNFSQ